MNRIKELQELIDKADLAYYTTGRAIMEDARYDKLEKELEQLNPSDPRLVSVGALARTNILQKKKHSIPMTSLNKATNQKEFEDYIRNNFLKAGIPENEILHASLKMDGNSIELEYKEGRLVSAITRGDGITGEDITANALKFKNLPKIACTKNKKLFTGSIRGEVILEADDWKKVDPDLISNPRNICSGICGRKDGSDSELLKFFAFSIYDCKFQSLEESQTLNNIALHELGFEIIPALTGLKAQVWSYFLHMQKIRSEQPFWIDGIVVKIDNIKKQLSLGETESSGCPKGQFAIKFEPEGAETVLRGVTLQVGQTGAIIPVANFDTIRLGGASISNANLCNWENIDALEIGIGDVIRVIKSGDIIPRIMEVVGHTEKRQIIPRPKECPVCQHNVGYKSNVSGDESSAIYCLNEQCPAVVIGKIQNYITSLDIQGIGDGIIASFVNQNILKKPSDLYLLDENIAHIDISGKVRLGEKRAQKILNNINARRELTLPEFLGSLGIFRLGKRRVQLIQDALPGSLETLEDWFTRKIVDNAEICGIPNIALRIYNEIMNQKDNILAFIKNGVIIKSKVKKTTKSSISEQYNICITGELSQSRKVYQQKIEDAGHIFATTVSSSTTHLCTSDPQSGSSKLKKAEKLGIKIINEEQLNQLIK